jgi:hypothetical protein
MELFRVEQEIASLLPSLTMEELHAFADTIEEPTCDAQIELFIYTCFFIFLRTSSMEYLGRAIQRTKGWAAVIANDRSDRPRRIQILDRMSTRKFIAENISPLVNRLALVLLNCYFVDIRMSMETLGL